MTTINLDSAFQAYREVRDAVQRIKQREAPSGTARPSDYWAEELEQIDYLADASPLIVRKLRHHAFTITGVRPYDYRDKADGRREIFESRLRALSVLDEAGLLVPESAALGGFGYEIDGRLFNVDTLKFYEVLIGMQRSGVLPALRALDRPVVCEIGAGWGGFAYQFKALFPRSTYVIVDFPELFLFSATYLKTVFPEARTRFIDGDLTASAADIRELDFVFVPHTHTAVVSSLPLDLAVNMVSFQEMTEAQVRAYVRLVAEAKCPWLYSLNRERSPYNTQLTSVSEVLAERYILTDVPLLDSDYPNAMKRPPKPGKVSDRSTFYQHRMGRLATSAAQSEPVVSLPARPDKPGVVLGMTLYNNARHLCEAIDSLLAQTYSRFLLVLLDDASGDDTERIAREYVARDERVRYFRHVERKAMIATWREVVCTGCERMSDRRLFRLGERP